MLDVAQETPVRYLTVGGTACVFHLAPPSVVPTMIEPVVVLPTASQLEGEAQEMAVRKSGAGKVLLTVHVGAVDPAGAPIRLATPIAPTTTVYRHTRLFLMGP